ncbi:ABC transporter permease [Dyadobacter fanqingshengii]|uniref:ABC transporter permease n=1 Tax=Dyadobacter fanqingshengii TaxID=2906443 RepID=A0A9X1PHQ1_9BACT|nr:ABC transporter permease [Dyadobacter fanqingshengii]MCF0043527.1 ABC transporter permease [Dyadobacter fanqingshengii]USJ34854.1 ABC transporter permease [Dyadobacter fanqingshengii]
MIRNYFKIAFRHLNRNKAYAILNVSGLTLGMTCGLLIFLLVKYHLGFDNFHANSERIYRIVTEQHRDNISYTAGVPSPLGKAFRNDYTFAEKVARIATFDELLVTVKQDKEVKKFNEPDGAAFAEEEYFQIFNFPLIEGDIKTALKEPNTGIITERLAKKYFGQQNPINQTFRLENKIDVTVKGVLKDLPINTDQQTEIFISYNTLKQYNEWLGSEDAWGGIQSSMNCYALLRPGVMVSEVEKVFPAYVKKYRPTSKNVHHYKLQPLADVHFDARYSGTMEKKNLWVLTLIGLFLIVTACVNFINLATAQALKLSKEVGVRKVLGSLRGQLFWQFIAQTSLITLIASAAALILSALALPYVNNLFSSQISLNLLSNWQLWLFLTGVIIIVTFLSGSYPGMILARFQPVTALKGKLSQQHIGGFNTRRALIVTQFAISQILIIGMIVIARQMHFAQQSDLGFNKDAVVMIPIVSSPGQAKTVKGKLQQIAGVENVSLCFSAPSSQNNWGATPFYDNRSEEEPFRISMRAADNDYLSTFDLKLVAGRNLFPSDTAKEFLVNETLAKKLNLASPLEMLGKTLKVNGDMSGPIVGIVKDFHDQSFHEEISAVCIPSASDNYNSYAVKINTNNVPATLAAIEKTWSAMHPDQLYNYEFLDEQVALFYETESLMFRLIQAFSVIAIFIGCLGLYGLVSFMAAQKTKEIGIRKVLGSNIPQILWIFGKEFSTLILISFAIASPLAWWAMNHWLAGFKFHIDISAWIFLTAIGATFLIAALTVVYQASKAALLDPVKSLKSE